MFKKLATDDFFIKHQLESHVRWLNGKESKENIRFDKRECDLSFYNFAGTNLSKAILQDSNLSTCNFICANLSKADLSGADLSRALLVATDLSKADLRWANLTDANLSEADLTGAVLINTVLKDAKIDARTKISKENLAYARLVGARIEI